MARGRSIDRGRAALATRGQDAVQNWQLRSMLRLFRNQIPGPSRGQTIVRYPFLAGTTVLYDENPMHELPLSVISISLGRDVLGL